MLRLKHFRDKAKGVADLLNYAALVDDGVVLGKDGSLLAGFYYRGEDAASLAASERNYIATRVNAALARFGAGWAFWIDAVRLPSASYPPRDASHFPDPITALIEEERRKRFLSEGAHFESGHVVILQYLPPLLRNRKLADVIYDDDERAEPESPASRQLVSFQRALDDFQDALGDALTLRRMRCHTVMDAHGREHLRDELVSYLQFCLTGELTPLNIPPVPMYLDQVMGGQELWPGDTPRIGDKFICCVAIEGFPHESFPGILDALDHLAIAYRFSTRFIFLDQHEALGELFKHRRKWLQRKRGFFSQVFKTQGGYVNEDAQLMATQADSAITDANSAMVAYGYYTPVIVLMGEDREVLLEAARVIAREIRRDGFSARVETVNTLEAWLGTLPGHAQPNVRRPLIHTRNLADLIPLSHTWPGLDSCPSPLFPKNSPPLLHAAAAGATPFRLNLHVSDVGHTLIFGPTGAGKSTLLAVIAAQFRRYRGARITAFDKGRSLFALVSAAGGRHYDLAGEDGSPGLCPLARLDTENDAAWAEDWLETCYRLQTNVAPTPRQREEIHRAIGLMRQARGGQGRTLTDFLATVQDADIRSALAPYAIDGPLGRLLDSRDDDLRDGSFTVFEIEELMGLGERNLIPVLLYLFRRFEKSLDGAPALLLLDEAWVMLGHPVFREKIREWLKVLRKANCAVVLATQSLSDAVKSGLLDVLLEACPTKILLPNEEADKAGTDQFLGPRDLYAMFGLNDVQIDIVKTAIKKRHYYYLSAEGRRLFDLGLGPMALAFCAVSSKEDVARVRQLQGEHGDVWPYRWLEEREVEYAALQQAA
jgi:type IV secretion system protein TrbE